MVAASRSFPPGADAISAAPSTSATKNAYWCSTPRRRGLTGSVPAVASESCVRMPPEGTVIAPVRIWIDMTAAAHVLVFRPISERLRERGHDVDLTARDYGQTAGLLEMHGIEATIIGTHAGASRLDKATALMRRTRAMRRHGAGRGFDLALAHGSNELAL